MELLKVLIADDEESIRNGLKCILDWEKCGYKICGEASNGKDALNQIIDLQPNLVILDIRMPGLTGIEILSQINEYSKKNNFEFPSIVILSGYADFEYAKQAINLGAKAYISKPVDEDELQKTVLQIAEDINEHKNLTEASIKADILQTKDCILQLLQNGKINPAIKYERLPFFENHSESNYQVILLDCNFVHNRTLSDIEKSLDNYFSFFSRVLISLNNTIVIVLKTTNDVAVQNCLERSAKLSNGRTFICLSESRLGIEGIVQSYKETKDIQKYLFFISNQHYISKEKLVSTNIEVDQELLKSKIEELLFSVETYDKQKLKKTEDELNKVFSNLAGDESVTKKNMIYCILELRNALKSKYPEREIVDGETFDVVQTILKMKTYEEAFIAFKKELNNFIENFNFNTADSVIVKVIAYVNSNYSNDLKLEALGDMFNCNSAYLGKKFRKHTGQQFNAYLDNIRIEKAKEMLRTTELRIYQISKIVGYSNTDYFFMKFKKSTGLTPKEYKSQGKNESE